MPAREKLGPLGRVCVWGGRLKMLFVTGICTTRFLEGHRHALGPLCSLMAERTLTILCRTPG